MGDEHARMRQDRGVTAVRRDDSVRWRVECGHTAWKIVRRHADPLIDVAVPEADATAG